MHVTRPPELKAHHLRREAWIHCRQSTLTQVRENTGSTEYQKSQVEHARALGWPETRIVLCGDLGESGTTTVNRPKYLEMVQAIGADRVGAVWMAALDRGGRDDIELQMLLKLCAQYEVLLFLDRRVIDLTDHDNLFVQQLMALVVNAENLRRRDTLRRGLLATVAMGKAVSQPPAGYVMKRKARGSSIPTPPCRPRSGPCSGRYSTSAPW